MHPPKHCAPPTRNCRRSTKSCIRPWKNWAQAASKKPLLRTQLAHPKPASTCDKNSSTTSSLYQLQNVLRRHKSAATFFAWHRKHPPRRSLGARPLFQATARSQSQCASRPSSGKSYCVLVARSGSAEVSIRRKSPPCTNECSFMMRRRVKPVPELEQLVKKVAKREHFIRDGMITAWNFNLLVHSASGPSFPTRWGRASLSALGEFSEPVSGIAAFDIMFSRVDPKDVEEAMAVVTKCRGCSLQAMSTFEGVAGANADMRQSRFSSPRKSKSVPSVSAASYWRRIRKTMAHKASASSTMRSQSTTTLDLGQLS